MKSQLRFLSGDPRKESDIRPYNPDLFSPLPPSDANDTMLLTALISGMALMLLHSRIAAGATILLLSLGISNSRGSPDELRQIVSCCVVLLFGCYSTYFILPGKSA